MFDFRRSHDCGTLNELFTEEKVSLSGWVHRRRDFGKLIFIDLRDRYGITQLIFDSAASPQIYEIATRLRQEWVISIKGIVRKRRTSNPNLKTGNIEVVVEELAVLSESKIPPFAIFEEKENIQEELRLKYRYLDLRKGPIINNLLIRHKAMLATRNYFDSLGFIEVSTPILSKSTPEGARDYLVPSRIYPGNFYALPQSPQIFKQLLMISGVDKYFQIAPCFRDEDLRADRQPEFIQIDIEMSFNTREELFRLIEGMLQTIFHHCLHVELKAPFERMTYRDAIERYGTDKPDLRFDMALFRLDEIAKETTFPPFQEGISKGFCIKKGASLISRKKFEEYTKLAKQLGKASLFSMKKTETGWSSSLTKFFTPELFNNLKKISQAERDDVLLIASGDADSVNKTLDHLRRHVAKEQGLISSSQWKCLWIIDFPLFSLSKETQEIQAEHHPFTHPHFDDLHLLEKEPLKTRALAYDLVINGYECASGSQRIHNSELQKKIFTLMQLTEESIAKKFGYFLEALQYGTPPHLGIALGFDRLVMLLCSTENIKDVIAFPKTTNASDLMQQTPSQVSQEQLDELALKPEKVTAIPWP